MDYAAVHTYINRLYYTHIVFYVNYIYKPRYSSSIYYIPHSYEELFPSIPNQCQIECCIMLHPEQQSCIPIRTMTQNLRSTKYCFASLNYHSRLLFISASIISLLLCLARFSYQFLILQPVLDNTLIHCLLKEFEGKIIQLDIYSKLFVITHNNLYCHT